MVAQKRQADNPASRPPKRSKTDDAPDSTSKPSTSQPRPVFTSALLADEGDFPRGGGTTLTPYELKEQRDEGRKEAEKEVGEEAKRRKKIKEQRERNRKGKGSVEKKEDKHDKDAIRMSPQSLHSPT
jgi:rRNA biogenesis protein RRP5